MDENAANYEENATAELVGDCIYMATTETFIEAMTDVGSIEDMLEESHLGRIFSRFHRANGTKIWGCRWMSR